VRGSFEKVLPYFLLFKTLFMIPSEVKSQKLPLKDTFFLSILQFKVCVPKNIYI